MRPYHTLCRRNCCIDVDSIHGMTCSTYKFYIESSYILWQSPIGKQAVPHWASMLRWIMYLVVKCLLLYVKQIPQHYKETELHQIWGTFSTSILCTKHKKNSVYVETYIISTFLSESVECVLMDYPCRFQFQLFHGCGLVCWCWTSKFCISNKWHFS